VTRRRTCFPSWRTTASREGAPDGFAIQTTSFRGDAKRRTRNLEIPGLALTRHPGMTESELSVASLSQRAVILRHRVSPPASPMTGSAKQSILPQRKYGIFVAPLLAMTANPNMRSRPRDTMCPSCAFISRPQGGRGECRVPVAPAASCALCIGRTHTSNNEYTGTPGIPARNGFNGLCRTLPGDRAVLPPSPADIVLSKPGWADLNSADLTPASGRQDHTILPYAATSLVRVPVIAQESLRTRPAIPSHARRCRVHRTPSRVRDDRDTPLCVGRDGANL
jgi:hypothetical protein